MPRGDRTGPLGMGPMTGRAAGYCAGYGMPGYANPMPGRGFGLGRARGWGGGWGRGYRWRHWFYATGLPGWLRFGYGPAWGPPAAYGPYAPSPDEELDALKGQAQWLKDELEAISKRIEELEGKE
ncbi:MAG: DUF5320 domain-containing protein [Anaerolineae bacterium]|nr:DUF5320 domain-containing protein [Anaerolineae bacterium]